MEFEKQSAVQGVISGWTENGLWVDRGNGLFIFSRGQVVERGGQLRLVCNLAASSAKQGKQGSAVYHLITQ